jgi:hypothetical protein
VTAKPRNRKQVVELYWCGFCAEPRYEVPELDKLACGHPRYKTAKPLPPRGQHDNLFKRGNLA